MGAPMIGSATLIEPISVSIPGYGFMALCPMPGYMLGRLLHGVDTGSIFSAQLTRSKTDGGLSLRHARLVLSPEMFPLTQDGKRVIGYEDPSRRSPSEKGGPDQFYCSRTFYHDTDSLSCDTVVCTIGPAGNVISVHQFLSPADVERKGFSGCVYVKEFEELDIPSSSKQFAIFEATRIDCGVMKSELGLAEICNGFPYVIGLLHTAADHGALHLSTSGVPATIRPNGHICLICNYAKEQSGRLEWQPIELELDQNLRVCDISSIRLLPALASREGGGPHGMSIRFVSGGWIDHKTSSLCMLSHCNDKELEVSRHPLLV